MSGKKHTLITLLVRHSMINLEPLILTFVANDSLSILFITIILTIIFNFYLRNYLSLLYRILPTWLFAYVFSLAFVRLYDNWLFDKVDSYAHFGGFMFSSEPDAPKLPPELFVYSDALNHDTWRNVYFLTGVVIAVMVVIIVEVLISIIVRIKSKAIDIKH
ncbi:hypothetical protein [Psychrobacter immobilis]|uniref:hypothetical protein n=1 Tax=Psychrobacter immobilis TaxID=498 RepID=UPI0019198234|nr:hypothetical protein [Psychrobacter immobilis]